MGRLGKGPGAVTREQIDFIAERAATSSSGLIAEGVGMTRNAVSGVIYRLRQAGDPRVPPVGQGKFAYFRSAKEQRDALADAFAEGAATLADAAAAARMSQSTAAQRWDEIRVKLGWQAR